MNEQIELSKGIIPVEELLKYENLKLPIFQRPYKWNTTHVSQMIEDIVFFKNKKSYRFGTIVLFLDENGEYNIVDGQQRTITLLLLVKAIITNIEKYKNTILIKKLNQLLPKLISFQFNSEISKQNIQQNYREVKRSVSRFDEDTILFLLEKCELVFFIINDITEAFQFFDSQNARGRDLDPHDLLKAYHLREFSKSDLSLQNQIVTNWENASSKDLHKLFAEYLYRIKGWVKGNASRHFSKNDIYLFKGIKIDETDYYPYTYPLRISHYFTDDYNSHIDRKIDNMKRSFPFQLDQVIINGRRFFEFVNYYKEITKTLLDSEYSDLPIDEKAREILDCINDYDSMYRTGDKYTRELFDCALIFYIDKFQYKEISRAVEKIFIWAYSIRLKYQNLQFASVDNYVVDEMNIFKLISDAITPAPVINLYIENIEQPRARKVNEIIKLFKKLNYYES